MKRNTQDELITDVYRAILAYQAEMKSPEYRAKGGEDFEFIGNALAAKGYRKSTDVARENFEEIEDAIADLEYRANTPRKTVKVEELKAQVNWVLDEVIPQTLAKLKKKYTEEVK